MFSFPFANTGSSSSTSSSGAIGNSNYNKGMSLLNRAGGIANTAMGIYANRVRSRMQTNRLNIESMFDDLQASQIETNAIAQSNAIKNQLLDNMSSATAMFANSGKDVASADRMNVVSRSNALNDILNVNSQSKLSAIQAKSSASNKRTQAKIASASGKFDRAGMRTDLFKQGVDFVYGAKGLIGG